MLRHDTFSKRGREVFPEIPFLAPPGFEESGEIDFPTQPILPQPAAWGDELIALEIEGVPSMRETLFFHRPSRTLIVCDLVFNFGKDEPVWTEVLLWAAVGGEHHPGMSRAFKLAIKDEARFKESMATMMAWDFDRVVVGHGDVIESGGKEKLARCCGKPGSSHLPAVGHLTERLQDWAGGARPPRRLLSEPVSVTSGRRALETRRARVAWECHAKLTVTGCSKIQRPPMRQFPEPPAPGNVRSRAARHADSLLQTSSRGPAKWPARWRHPPDRG